MTSRKHLFSRFTSDSNPAGASPRTRLSALLAALVVVGAVAGADRLTGSTFTGTSEAHAAALARATRAERFAPLPDGASHAARESVNDSCNRGNDNDSDNDSSTASASRPAVGRC